MVGMPGGLSRRQLLTGIGSAGGAAALYLALGALDLLAPLPAYAGPPRLPAEAGKGIRIAILGGGLAGLVCAYELSRAGYACTVLEARERVGGRNLTVRRGARLHEQDSTQECRFDDGPQMYFNCGPARLPGHHRAVLGYCRDFGIALEVISNDNRSALLHSAAVRGGQPLREAQVVNDARGYVAELLAKAVDAGALEQQVSTLDHEKLREFLRQFGDLDEHLAYRGTARVPYATGGFLEPGTTTQPLALSELLASDFWQFKMNFGEMADQAATMLQPVGGMDHVVRAFEQRVEPLLRRSSPVTRIVNRADGVEVVYRDLAGGRERRLEADYAIVDIPMPLLAGLENNFSDAYRQALAAVPFAPTVKVGLQARRRFWEEDAGIYGGISWTDQDITQIWYPSAGVHGPKGILLGAYTFFPPQSERLGQLAPPARIEAAIRQGEHLHPGYGREIENGVAIAWHRVPYMPGCSARWTPEARQQHFATLTRPEGRCYLVGDQVTYHPGWQEGAIRSAHAAIAQLQQRVVGAA
jgi:monoamine oxidase